MVEVARATRNFSTRTEAIIDSARAAAALTSAGGEISFDGQDPTESD